MSELPESLQDSPDREWYEEVKTQIEQEHGEIEWTVYGPMLGPLNISYRFMYPPIFRNLPKPEKAETKKPLIEMVHGSLQLWVPAQLIHIVEFNCEFYCTFTKENIQRLCNDHGIELTILQMDDIITLGVFTCIVEFPGGYVRHMKIWVYKN